MTAARGRGWCSLFPTLQSRVTSLSMAPLCPHRSHSSTPHHHSRQCNLLFWFSSLCPWLLPLILTPLFFSFCIMYKKLDLCWQQFSFHDRKLVLVRSSSFSFFCFAFFLFWGDLPFQWDPTRSSHGLVCKISPSRFDVKGDLMTQQMRGGCEGVFFCFAEIPLRKKGFGFHLWLCISLLDLSEPLFTIWNTVMVVTAISLDCYKN